MAATQYTETQAIQLINAANGTNFATFVDIENKLKAIPNPNGYLTSLSDKLTKQYTLETFRAITLKFWDTAFIGTNRETIETGALAEIVGLAIPEVEDDIITKPEDLLPNLSVIPQLVQNLMISHKKRVELNISKGVYERAFLNIDAFNSFIGEYNGAAEKAITRYLYREWMKLMNVGIKRTIDMKSLELKDAFITLFKTIADEEPFSQTFNLGWNGTDTTTGGLPTLPAKPATIPAGDSANVYLTDKSNAKVNDIEKSGKKWTNLNLVISARLKTEYDALVLSNTFHTQYLALEEMFNKIIVVDRQTYTQAAPNWNVKAGDELLMVIDNRAIFNAQAINANKVQAWAKGTGDGLIQKIDSFWVIMGIIPFMNGAKFKFTVKQPTPPAVQADESDDIDDITVNVADESKSKKKTKTKSKTKK